MRIALLGDIGLFGRHVATNPDWERHFAEVADVLSGYDLVVGNLETPFSTSGTPAGGKSAYLRASPRDVEILKMLNVQAVTLANNHMLDFGPAGLNETCRVLERAGIDYYGVGGRKLTYSSGSTTVRLLGYCSYDTNPLGLISGHLNTFAWSAVADDLDEAVDDGAYPIVSCHFGIEHRSYPLPRHQAAFARLAEDRAFTLHGHHPHVFQPVEISGKALLAYSLGNFCFDDVLDDKSGSVFLPMGALNRISGILSLSLEGGAVPGWSVLPLRDDGDRLLVGDAEAQAYIDGIQAQFSSDRRLCEITAAAQRADFVSSRVKRRDLKFYLQRLRPRYAQMIISEFINRRLDARCVPF